MVRNLRVFIVAISSFLLLMGNPANLAAVEFAAAKTYPVGTNPQGVAVSDFNGDGKPDLAVANQLSGNVSILLGNGDGTFQPAVNYSAGNSPTQIVADDFNADGKLDLALFQPGQNSPSMASSVSVLLGNGDGTFQAPKTTVLTSFATAMAVADFNLDKKSDVAVSNVDSSTGTTVVSLSIFLGNGDGTFQSSKQTPLPGVSIGAIAPADFNGDSKPDVAVTTSVGTLILLGKGDGTFSQGAMLLTALPAHSVLTGDLNHDGKTDLVVGSSRTGCGGRACPPSSKLSVFLGNGDGSFQGEQVVTSGGSSAWVAVGDFNGDGKLDVAYPLVIQLGKGDGTFSPAILSPTGQTAPAIVVQDLNGDTLSDFIGFPGSNDMAVFLNTSPNSGADVGILSSRPSGTTVDVGINLTYTADVLNQGPKDATGVIFTDTLPSNVNFVSATASQGSCVQSNGIVSCTIGSLASAFDFTVSIVVTPTATGTITNSMSVAANEPDLVPANNTATQTNTIVPVFTLTVTKTGNGSGTVTSGSGVNGATINCGTTCSATFLSGTVVNVFANPDANSLFANWSGACTGTDPNTCTITLNSNQSVTATFNLPPPDFILTAQPSSISTQKGMQVTDTLTLTGQNGFAGAVTLRCAVTGPAPLATCKVSPSPVTLGSSPGTATLTITAPATLAALALPLSKGSRPLYAAVLPLPALLLGAIGLVSRKFRNRRRGLWLLGGSVIVLFAVLAGCGGGSTTPPPQNFAVTVTATSGSLQHSTTVTLTVQ